MADKICKEKRKSIDPVSQQIMDCALEAMMAWDRLSVQEPQCGFGKLGVCCRNCAMGPCQIDPLGEGPQRGVCGATAETIAARNFVRMIAAGAAAHSDHGRGVAEVFLAAARGKAPGYGIKDEQKLYRVAMDLGIEIGKRSVQEIAVEVGEKCMDREIVEIMHRTHIGVDQDMRNLMLQGSRCALGDGWGGSMIATELQDIMFGTPVPIISQVNLGILEEDNVNIVIHGHEPLLSEMIVLVAREKEMLDHARSKGAKGITLGGICCTANEILMRHGIPIAGNFLQQELAIATGAVEAMVVDIQCIMESLPQVAQCFHTKILTTNARAKMAGAEHIPFEEHDAINAARRIVRAAVDNFPNRKGKPRIPKDGKMDLIAGFSHETIDYLLGGLFRASYRPLNDNIINGKIRGIAGVVGCNNPKETHDSAHLAMVKHLIKNNVIVLQTGCSAIASAKDGLLLPEGAAKHAGAGLAEVCETVGIPPVLHMGSCVDNSRILMAATAVVKEGGLGDDISDLPAAGAAPEWMSEKAISIGHYFVASGVYTVFGVTFPTFGSKKFTDLLFKEYEKVTGGMWDFEPDPIKAADKMIAHIDRKRQALGLDKKKERVLYDMAMRRELGL
jgi:carbon-monoxide dehydrogenase catalytic subunit